MLSSAIFSVLLATTVSGLPAARQTSSQSPCAQLFNATLFPPSAVKACLNSIPFREDVRKNVMAMATAMYTIDIFQYNQLDDSNSVFDQNVDIQAEFQRINSTQYSSDYAFQSDLSNVMNSLNDGHHGWSSCYTSSFRTTHQAPIVALRDNANDTNSPVNIYLAPDLPLYAYYQSLDNLYTQRGINTSALAGAQVLTIEGQNAWDYLLQNELKRVGQYQDPEQRLNSIFAGYTAVSGQFARNAGGFTGTASLDKDNVTLTVKSVSGQQGTVVVPWITAWQGNAAFNYSTGEAFFNANCLKRVSTATPSSGPSSTSSTAPAQTSGATTQGNQTSSSSGSGLNGSLTDIAPQLYRQCPIPTFQAAAYPFASVYSPQNTSAYLGGRDIQFYNLQNKTGVIFIPTFEPEGSNTQACSNRFLLDAILGLQNFSKAGVENVLIDTSNNGGGSISLNEGLQRLITGEQFLEDINFQSVFRKANLSVALAAAHRKTPNITDGSFGNENFRNGSQPLPASEDYFTPGGSRQINGKTLYTSDLLEDSITAIQAVDMAFNLSDAAPYPPKNIVFTGNGLCGSACASFTNFLIEYYNATAYISAARPSNPIEFQAFAAGQASNSDSIYEEAQALGYNNSAVLPPLGVVGRFSFALRASISPRIAPGQFLQYRSYPAQHRFSLNAQTYLNPLTYWKYVATQAFK